MHPNSLLKKSYADPIESGFRLRDAHDAMARLHGDAWVELSSQWGVVIKAKAKKESTGLLAAALDLAKGAPNHHMQAVILGSAVAQMDRSS